MRTFLIILAIVILVAGAAFVYALGVTEQVMLGLVALVGLIAMILARGQTNWLVFIIGLVVFVASVFGLAGSLGVYDAIAEALPTPASTQTSDAPAPTATPEIQAAAEVTIPQESDLPELWPLAVGLAVICLILGFALGLGFSRRR